MINSCQSCKINGECKYIKVMWDYYMKKQVYLKEYEQMKNERNKGLSAWQI